MVGLYRWDHLHTSDLAVKSWERRCYRSSLREGDCSNQRPTSLLYNKYLMGVLWGASA